MGPAETREQGLRRRLAKELRLDDEEVEWLWERLIEYDRAIIRDAVDGGEREREDLLAEAKRILDIAHSSPFARRTAARSTDGEQDGAGGRRRRLTDLDTRPVVLALLNGYEGERAGCVSRAVALDAATQEPVRRFRQLFLSEPLPPAQATALVYSVAAAVFPLDHLAAAGVPLIGHRAVLEDVAHDGDVLRAWVRVDPPGTTLQGALHGIADVGTLPRLVSRGENGWPVPVSVWPGSVLDAVRAVSAYLTRTYLWPAAEATWFVLTWQTPLVSPVRTWVDVPGHENYSRAVITVEAEPWVSAATVEAVYRALQRRVLGGTNHRLGERTLAMFRFVLDRVEAEGGCPFRQLAEEWNRHAVGIQRPEWRYEDLDMLSRDFKRARRALLAPDYPGRMAGSTHEHTAR